MNTHRKNFYLRATRAGARRLELVKNAAKDESTLYAHGIIGDDFFGDGISALDFAKAVAQAPPGTLHLRINSPGGDVFEGRAMAQSLREFKGKVIAHVDGMAASAATFLTCAASQVIMAKGSMLMVHNASSYGGGNSEDFRAMASLLDKIDGQIAQDYASVAGVSVEQARAWMQATTYFTDAEAVDAKLATMIAPDEDGTNARAAWDMSAYPNMPTALSELERLTASALEVANAAAASAAVSAAAAAALAESAAAAEAENKAAEETAEAQHAATLRQFALIETEFA